MTDVTRALCATCKQNIAAKGRLKCNTCGRGYSRKSNHIKEGLKSSMVCSSCSFVAINKCQLDVDHKDGNHSNNSPDNLTLLCANCHRLKTWLSRDYRPSPPKEGSNKLGDKDE